MKINDYVIDKLISEDNKCYRNVIRQQSRQTKELLHMLKFKLLFGRDKLEFTDIDVALRSALELSEKFNVHMVVYYDDKVLRHVMIKEED